MPKLGVTSKVQLQAILEYTQVLNRAKSCQIRRPPPFVDSFMDGCGEAVEAAEAAEAAKT